MLGQSLMAANQTMDSRMFVYEVAGLSETDQTAQAASPIRTSGTMLFPVPFNRMGAFMQRMNRLGGSIVAIHSSWDAATQSAAAPAADTSEADAEE